jgi:hypothetical protein
MNTKSTQKILIFCLIGKCVAVLEPATNVAQLQVILLAQELQLHNIPLGGPVPLPLPFRKSGGPDAGLMPAGFGRRDLDDPWL